MDQPASAKPDRNPATASAMNSLPFDPAAWTALLHDHGHSGFIGMHYLGHGDGWVEMGLNWREDLVGDPETGILASGPIISLLDSTTSLSVWTQIGKFQPQVTLDLRIDYTRAATPGKAIVARAQCYQLRRSMAFVRGIAHDGDVDDPVAHAVGVFMLIEGNEWAKS